ncbi:MAG TPA: deaminase [Candidatus Saccharimonadales bacterium]|jgi:dCMP deaminase
MKLTPEEKEKQIYYRDARTGGYYGKIWTTVGKCVFCDLRDKYIVHEENGIVLTVALFAYIDGNLMIIPRRHVKSVKELTDDEWQTVRKFMYIAKKIIRNVRGLKDIQYVVRDGGLAVNSTVQDHLHMHCIPSDAPDLTVWNYRKLKYTPLENADLFRKQQKKITDLSKRFKEKYADVEPLARDKKEVYREAFEQALRSKKASQAKKTAKVGAAVIVGDKIISMPNANLVGGPMEHEKDGIWVSPPTVSHAEECCISQAAKDGVPLKDATMIVTLSPCMTCSRLIVNSGIKELHYIDDWWDKNALDFLSENGVKVVKLPYKKK